ncbi:MFS transporter [Halosimplex aquaticum]|uniref:MFS transporter n=1 Tax=Halosimplex aquaticum TaxID=3026162 RepID=A0ABD5Y3S7_9EURY|nr:MFS transporter [Halosimplex aquaticum]
MVVPDRYARFDALALTALVWFLGKFLRYAFPPLFGTLGSTYGVSRTVLGSAFTGLMLVYAAMQFPSGLLADRLGSVRVITAGALVAAAAALALAVDAPLWVLIGAMALVGAGTGTYKTVGVSLLSRAYPARTGRALGIFDTFGTFGGVAAPAAVVVASGLPAAFGAPWRSLFLAAGVVGVGLAVGFARVVPRRLPDEPAGAAANGAGPADGEPASADDVTGSAADGSGDGGVPLGAYVALFRDRRFALFVVVTICFSFAYNGAVAFLPLYLAEETAVSEATANLLFSVLFVVSLVQLVTGEASDRVGVEAILALTLGVATAGLLAVLALSATGGPVVLGGAVVLLGLGAHGYRPVRGAYMMSVVPESVAGGSLGVVRTLLMAAGAVSPAIVGYLSETAGFGTAFQLLAAALVAATALSLVLWALGR